MSKKELACLITGAAKRVGACIARHLHEHGWRVVIHHRDSEKEAQALCEELNQKRAHSAAVVQADLTSLDDIKKLSENALQAFGRMDALINNASSFYPTPLESATEKNWEDLFGTNAKAPFFLARALLPALKESKGVIINMVDIHADLPIADHPLYCMAKAALVMMTKSLAKDLGPDIRVNAIAPGIILWPDNDSLPDKIKTAILNKIPLKRAGEPMDIARSVQFLLEEPYITGHLLKVDGGRSLV